MPRQLCVCVLLLIAMMPLGFESARPKTTTSPEKEAGEAQGAASASPSRGALPPLKLVTKKTAILRYTLANAGPSGLGSLDVYVTRDEGGTWAKCEDDPGSMLPEVRKGREIFPMPLTGFVNVKLPNDGIIYGFYLVVTNRAGVGKSAPKSGDFPHVRLEVDTTQPLAELYQPQPDEGQKDSLLLTWKAEDKNLATEPITLEWSGDGRKWNPIGEPKLRNTGRFIWKLPANLPSGIYLKLTVRDKAGNVAVAQTSEGVVIDLKRPEIVDVTVVD